MAGGYRGQSGRTLVFLAASLVCVCLLQRALQAFNLPADRVPSRRSVLLMGTGGFVAAEAVATPAFAEKTKAEVQEQCLSNCVYKCTGGARGKGSEYKNRRVCIEECKDECLGGEKAAFLEEVS
mmetsp:Transcript_27492/g.63572  ORF Transcript_27492/g.63572 Transcript_27492/m.63572 type:complete len:124 (-) Transcript_27492:160-531(-)